MMIFKDFVEGMAKRLGDIDRRMEALERERSYLTQEKEHIGPLVEIWKKVDYDPIIEERRVTEKMVPRAAAPAAPVSDNVTELPKHRKPPTAKGTLLTTIGEIMMDSTDGIRYNEIIEQLRDRMGYKVSTGAVYYNLAKMMKRDDELAVTQINGGAYKLKAYLEASAN